MYYWLFFFTMQRPVEFICWNSDSKCFHGEVSTHRPCLKKTLPSALTVLWKKLKKMTWEEEKWRSRVVLLGTKCENLLGDKTRRCGCLCLRGGSKEGRIWAPTVWLKAMGTSLTSDGCKPAPHEEAGRTGWAVLKERQPAIMKGNCHWNRVTFSRQSCAMASHEAHCAVLSLLAKESSTQVGFKHKVPPENSFNCVHSDKQLY